MAEFRSVRLPEKLCSAAEARWNADFGTVENLISFLLQELTREEVQHWDRAEEQMIEQRLRDLGYV